MLAFAAPVDARLGLVRGPCLPDHEEGLVVAALGALRLCFRHGVVGVVQHQYLPLLVHLSDDDLLARGVADLPASLAPPLPLVRSHQAVALAAEHGHGISSNIIQGDIKVAATSRY